MSALPPYISRKRKHPFEFQSLRKSATGPSTCPELHKVVVDAPYHGIRKGLMTSQGAIAFPPLPLLVKDREYAVDTTRSIVRDADLDKCSDHETEPLGDFGLFDMMRVCCTIVASSVFSFVPFVFHSSPLNYIHPFLSRLSKDTVSNNLIWFILCRLHVMNILKIVGANTIIMKITQRETK